MGWRKLLWLGAAVVVAVIVAIQTVRSSAERSRLFAAEASMPTVTAGVDVLWGITVVPRRTRGGDYRRAAFGEAWTDDNDAPGGHNGCDTRNDILDRDLVDKTYVHLSRCPRAVAGGVLHDPYTGKAIKFLRGNKTGSAIQVDHIVPLAFSWEMGARDWPESRRLRFANDPANLIAVEGQANQDKGDKEPAFWMPPSAAFRCQYAMQFIAVLRGYGLAVDAPSVSVLRKAADTCPTG
ncbi:extracellular deoxyribonuclease [Mycobacteroides abscessus subsp. abscessus]|uniref:HNH endonuclease n=1 Tax=Mycobacteroides abscessus TaxID=36809 RepID=A0ABD7HNM2_9MYCO|nr:HNH endonuclease family protein [Mycobacteroides abscessus]PVA30934.1 HNH endonuclease [Mycobacteroides abscessus]PVA49844.1 HNH endonuclease [Mycobacteroides abscessus]RIQ88876.1 HNH endonuclease [Mycobacteroides abscessus]RIR01108.1 HNH endonuclease [Mycobacteroides abscessus]RIR40560.1 HNH endonuclease [Mycobacteroides abscessus]